MSDVPDPRMPPDPNPGLQMVDKVYLINDDGTLTELGAGARSY